MKILADKNIPHIYELFNLHNDVQTCEGRIISTKNLKDIDVLIVRSVTTVNQALLADSFLKFIGTATSGIDHIDKNFLKKYEVPFVSAPGSNAIAVVEYVFTALFWLAQRDKFFLRDKIIGIVGVGHIGNLLRQRLNNFGIHTLLCDPFLSQKCNKNHNWKSLEELVSEVDILTLHTPLTYDGEHPTWHMINIDVLEALSSKAILINTCRGSVIDNSALLKILKNGKKLSVVLDVWESEPALSIPLVSYVDIGTPHIAGYTIESKMRGIIHIYHEYCKLFNIFDNVCTSLLLFPIVYNVSIPHEIDETSLYQLIRYMYDIRFDDVMFRRCIFTVGGFDKFRRCYTDRREWSSLCIKTCSDYNYKTLTSLGFNVNII